MDFVFILVIGILLIGGLFLIGVVPFGAPYLPTLQKRVEDGLDLLDLQAGQTMLELGCGDGRLLKAAAKRGINSVGYELNPVLVLYARLRCFRYRDHVSIVWGNYWKKDWPPSDGMYVFLLQPYMSKLHNRIMQYTKDRPYKVVSFAFQITEKQPKTEKNGMHLYIYK